MTDYELPKENDDYKDLEGLAFEHGPETMRGQQEREEYRAGLRRGIGGKNTYVNPDKRYSEHR